MRSFPAALVGAAWALLFFGTAGARAELIQWSYSWSNSPTQVHADSPGTGYISLTDGSLKSAAGSSYFVPPGPTGAVNSGSVAARADVTVSMIFHLPEPSSGVLAFLGATCGLAFVRRRRPVPEFHSR